MKKKSFALSWGRKMFFGLGWALTSLMALNYLQSMIIPQTVVGWMYFLTTFVGHYGLLLSLVYFFIYYPVVYIFPSYYVSRIWSIILLLAVNAFIFFDSYLFTRYRFHINSFLWDFLQDKDALSAFGFTPLKLGLIGVVMAILFFVIWFRGEKLWRTMQGRFSNPVKNWYLVLIAICLMTSHLLHMYGDVKGARYITRLAQIFPLHFPLTGKSIIKEQKVELGPHSVTNQGYKDFFYPAKDLNCPMKQPKNILMIVMDHWSAGEMNAEVTPNIFHFSTHGLVFDNHYSGGLNTSDGYFSLLYSLPPVYTDSVLNQSTSPVFLDQIKKSKIDATFFNTGASTPLTHYLPEEKEILTDYIESNLAERDDLAKTDPFLMHVFLGAGSLADKDNQVKMIVDQFIKHKQSSNTIIILTGAYSESLKTPLVIIWPGKQPGSISKLTTHYDVLPSLMLEDWKCKNPPSDFSFGKNIFSKDETDKYVAGTYKDLKIVDITAGTVTSISPKHGVEVSGNDKRDVSAILDALQNLTTFYKKR